MRRPSLPFIGDDARLQTLCLASLGIIYGDIGTSPLYTLRECFQGAGSVSYSEENLLGVLSLIVWSLLFLVSFMYVGVILRADNDGEGGVMALTALVTRERPALGAITRRFLLVIGVFGAALLYGDGVLTPAVSVLGAIEGLEVIAPSLTRWVVPLSAIVIIALFWIQYRGTGTIGSYFGPVMLAWFGTLGVVGLCHVLTRPSILLALDPTRGFSMLLQGGWSHFFVLGPVFLAVTGAEAMYADMGHFGRRPVRLSWFMVVLPCLILNYLGQGALLLKNPSTLENPFYHMVPGFLMVPMLLLATAAAVIASQSAISEVFSLTRQGMLLGYLPRMDVRHTSEHEMGQVYLPGANLTLLFCTLLLVMVFQSASGLTSAYGLTVAFTVVITGTLSFFAMRDVWGWSSLLALLLAGAFVITGGIFVTANLAKLVEGGWIPLAIGLWMFISMRTWRDGRALVRERLLAQVQMDSTLESELARVHARMPGSVVYMTGVTKGLPPALLQNLRHNRSLHECVVFLTIQVQSRPYVPPEEQIVISDLGGGIHRVVVYHGFMEHPKVIDVLGKLPALGVPVDPGGSSIVLGRETLVSTGAPGLSSWRKLLFILMARNAPRATDFYKLPSERVLEIGIQIDL